MKKFGILPLIAIATLGGMTLPLVSCKKGGSEEYDLQVETVDENITVETTKFKLHHDLTISYSTTDYHTLDPSGSTITIGQTSWLVTDCIYDNSTVTIPANMVNSGNVVVSFKSLTPLCFTNASGDGTNATISYYCTGGWRDLNKIEYSRDLVEWHEWSTGGGITLEDGQSIYVHKKDNVLSKSNRTLQFRINNLGDGKVKASGDVNSMINYGNLSSYCFNELFVGNKALITAPSLPSFNAPDHCYRSMFKNCSSLTTAPELPAKTLEKSCYINMFLGCSNLLNGPDLLPAETLSSHCYAHMFYGCDHLIDPPEISANVPDEACCWEMFCSCSSLTTAPAIHFTTFANGCCTTMFRYCSNLKIKENSHDENDKLILDLNGFDESVSEQLKYMFQYCFSGPGYFTETPTAKNKYYFEPQS